MAERGDPVRVADLRAFLLGRWRIDRAIEDRRRGAAGRFVGLGVFVPDGAGLLYTETGRLSLPDHEGAAEQRHLYRFPAAGRAEVFFRHGGFFHDIDLTDGAWRAGHPCGDDLYRGEFRALGPDCWEQIWRVRGPRKDLSLEAEYRRLAEPVSADRSRYRRGPRPNGSVPPRRPDE